jgi:hypothetical protein
MLLGSRQYGGLIVSSLHKVSKRRECLIEERSLQTRSNGNKERKVLQEIDAGNDANSEIQPLASKAKISTAFKHVVQTDALEYKKSVLRRVCRNLLPEQRQNDN